MGYKEVETVNPGKIYEILEARRKKKGYLGWRTLSSQIKNKHALIIWDP